MLEAGADNQAASPPIAGKHRALPPATVAESAPVTATTGNIGKCLALVIGNANYEHVVLLKNAVNGALAIANLFRSLGFSVITGTAIISSRSISKRQVNYPLRQMHFRPTICWP